MPKVSVIVPVYNAQNYIERCLTSISEQTYQDYEVIIVDDGSTDSSAQICKKICEGKPEFFYHYQENSGPDMARKAGTMIASGDFIMYVDADDYVSAGYLEHAIKTSVEYDADLVCSQIIRFDENKEWPGSKHSDSVLVYSETREAMKAYFVDDYLKGTYYAKLVRSEIIKDYPFIKDAVIGEDISAALYMIKKANKIAVIPDEDYYYFWNTNSISHSGYTRRHRISLENYMKVRNSILDEEYVEKAIVCGYFAEYEMAVATAMSRSWTYDIQTGKVLREDIAKFWKYIRLNKKTPLYMKTCMRIYMTSPKLFLFLYRIIYLITGR